MNRGTRRKEDSKMVEWAVEKTGENAVEIHAPGVKYAFEARPRAMRVQAFKGTKVIETSSFERRGHDFTIEATDSRDSRIRLTLSVEKGRITTDVDLNGETFQLESPAAEHGLLLTLSLKKRKYPSTPLIKRFADELRDNKALRAKVQRRTAYGHVVTGDLPNGPMAVCVAVCAMCALEVALACLMCFECLENPPDMLMPGTDVSRL